ncbi:2-dehydro-3-deoxygluconokinase [candidate division MSBL1 archaeon SCGC-AAA259E19]|uniref:2-dehydro-3-deoxygluconokinase n=1 Tax=candidate division MSBL1 archaeon SCGC-AAA259E19 TaxID=1698264 RepID=A0A133ULI4_9EURY|nr:2-dehydro-3-deoxygluconokinase [candidate division MSBL1 archaeon SCGC-AAA259E19]
MSGSKEIDVVSLGETMIRYSPKDHNRLEQAEKLEAKVGGTESNFSVLLSQLGMKVVWISKLTDNPLGRLIARKIRGFGVDTSKVIWTKNYRVGKYYLEFGKPPRPTKVIYDRKNSAISNIQPDELDPEVIEAGRIFHTTGITTALSESCKKTVLKAMGKAGEDETKVSFDLNYRSKLWGLSEAKDTLEDVLDLVDLLMADKTDVEKVLKISGSSREVAETLANRFDLEVSVLTLGGEGAIAVEDGKVFEGKPFEIEEVDRIGAGDAFDAGFIYGYQRSGVQKGLDYGLAAAALKHTIPGDLALLREEEIEDVIKRRARKEKSSVER